MSDRRDEEREREAREALEAVRRDSEALGSSSIARMGRRLGDHFGGRDAVGAAEGGGTDPIELTGLSEGRYERRVALDPPRPQVRYSVGDVRVSFSLDREIVERTIERLQVTPLGTARVELRPPLVNVTLRGEPAVVNALDPAQIVPTVEVGDATVARPGGRVAGTSRATVTISHVPAGTTLVRIEPTDVIVVPVR